MEKAAVPPLTPLGVYSSNERVFLFSSYTTGDTPVLLLDESQDGFHFTPYNGNPLVADHKKRMAHPDKMRDVRVALHNQQYYLTYTYRKFDIKDTYYLYGARAEDLLLWQKIGQLADIEEPGVVVSGLEYSGKKILYYGAREIRVAYSVDGETWEKDSKPVLTEYKDFYGSFPLTIGNAIVTEQGIMVMYYVTKVVNGATERQLRAVLTEKDNPGIVRHAFADPLWTSPKEWATTVVRPLGVVPLHGQLVSYWFVEGQGIVAVLHPMLEHTPKGVLQKTLPKVILQKLGHNPILKPLLSNFWESKAVFNPAAIYDNGKVHLIYRAIGDQDISVLGYATSSDGVTIDERLPDPIYLPTQPFEMSSSYIHAPPTASAFASGGGAAGGCEDPRVSRVGDRIYMTYVAYDGWSPPRVALTSIHIDDFRARNWDWDTPVLVTKPDEVNKNACVLPEKINGKFVVFHRVFPNILIDYVDDLKELDGKNKWLKTEARIAPRPRYWDSRKVGVGAPPIKTADGWLLIYQAVGDQDAGRYKMGAMLLDPKDPSRVLYRSRTPILEPNEWYENDGFKAGVAYPCGSVIVEDNLYVYYGGADTVVCVAQAPLNEFLYHLKSGEAAELHPVQLHK